ncbi:vomeronasal type-2 receptor 116-like, partial [Sigmodon hispidus]
LSFGPFDTILNDRGEFSFLYQTAPKETSLPHAIVSLMVYFSWNWVGLVLKDDHRGAEILSALRGEMDRYRVCVAFADMIVDNLVYFESDFKTTHQQILKSSANVIIIHGVTDSLYGVFISIRLHQIMWKVWIMTSKWNITTIFQSLIFDSLHGSLIFAHHHTEISDFRKVIQNDIPSNYPEDHILARLWVKHFNCSFSKPECKIL